MKSIHFKRVLSVLLTLVLAFTMLPVTAMAEENGAAGAVCVHTAHDTDCGYTEDAPCAHVCGAECGIAEEPEEEEEAPGIGVNAAAFGIVPAVGVPGGLHNINNDGPIVINADDTVTITGTGVSTNNTIKVNSGITAYITLENVNIRATSCAFDIAAGATVYLTLNGNNTLTSSTDYSGLFVPYGATLTINGSGSLTAIATGPNTGAGIGGNNNINSCGTITINSGTVTATGYHYGAGIGGSGAGNGGDGGTVTINGGTVTATSTGDGTGIGGGSGSGSGSGGNNGGTLKITGGTVTANNMDKTYAATPTNGSSNDVYLVTLTLDNVSAVTPVTGITSPAGYGITGVTTDAGGKLYFYLPAGDTDISLTAGGTTYDGSLTVEANNTNAVTLTESAQNNGGNNNGGNNNGGNNNGGNNDNDNASNGSAGDNTDGTDSTPDTTETPSDDGTDTTTQPPAPGITSGDTTVNAGILTTNGNTSTLTVNQETLGELLETASGNLTITVPSEAGTAIVELVMQNMDDMADKGVTLTVQTGNVQYELPAEAIDTAAILTMLGADSAADVSLSITISTDVNPAVQAAIDSIIAANGGEIIIPPIEFKIIATYNGETVEINTFSNYVSRSIEVTEEQAKKITTAIVIEPDGTIRHVPTYVYQKDGKWYYAVVNSLTNSTYALVHNERTFTDASGKWFEGVVNEMGSRMIIDGINDTEFGGEFDITRAAFADIIIRALGLPANGNGTVFADVRASTRYCGAVGKAFEYGIISGVGNGMYAPDKKITRQEAMLMIQRAAQIAGFKGSTGKLYMITDAGSISDWALPAVRWNVSSGLVTSVNGQLRPQDNITRAETAALVLAFLQKAELVDVRTPLPMAQANKKAAFMAVEPRKEEDTEE